MVLEVRNNEAASRYELFVDGEFRGFADYHDRGDAIVFPHTVITAPHRGNGLGAQLVRGALDDVRRRGRRVVAQCWYVAEFIEEHPGYRDLLAA
jgi:predicted GNAT family acetyltransferase